VAGRHRKVSHARHRHHALHRKPLTVSRMALPAGTAVAVLAVVTVGFNAVADGGTAGVQLGTGRPAAVASAPPEPTASVLAFSTARAHRDAQHRASTHRQRHPRAPHRAAAPALRIMDTGQPCYLRVSTVHGHLLTERIVHGHQHVTFRRHGLDVVLGNAGAVRIAVAGHRFHRAGRSGQVLRFRVH
jgi:hypothetical protein